MPNEQKKNSYLVKGGLRETLPRADTARIAYQAMPKHA